MRQFDLKTISSDCAAKIKTAKLGVNYFIEPFKHLVIDNFFEKSLAELCWIIFLILIELLGK